MSNSMSNPKPTLLPPIPAKRYFTIGEVSELCQLKPHVLRYWEQEFTQLNPVKRRGNRRYYQHHEVILIRRIRELLYEQGFTIVGARSRLEIGNRKKVIHSNSVTSDTPESKPQVELSYLPNTENQYLFFLQKQLQDLKKILDN